MGHATKPTRQNRTITVDFHDETTYFHLLLCEFARKKANLSRKQYMAPSAVPFVRYSPQYCGQAPRDRKLLG